jgi:hypothetical protein
MAVPTVNARTTLVWPRAPVTVNLNRSEFETQSILISPRCHVNHCEGHGAW